MRKSYIALFLSLVFLAISIMPVFAGRPLERNHARHVFRRTALVIVTAQKAAREGKQYVGLGKSIAHQRFARQLYKEGFYFRAVTHSLRARTIAIQVIRRNKAELIKEATLDKIENIYYQKMPPNEHLDRQVAQNSDKDESAVDIDIEIEIGN